MGRRLAPWALASALALSPSMAGADTLHTEASAREGDYVAVEELGYEVILDASAKDPTRGVQLTLRVTLHNDSDTSQDALLSLALPRSSRLRSFATRRGGGPWSEAIPARNRSIRAQRGAGSIYARELPPSRDGGLPTAEVAAFALTPASTTQLELRLDAYPTLDGDRWALELPRRNISAPNLTQERRVVVRDLPAGDGFFIDDSPNAGAKYMVTRASDTVTLAWPAHMRGGDALEGTLETMSAVHGASEGDAPHGAFRVALRLGASAAKTPDHVVFVVDRSASTAPHVARSSHRVFNGILDTLPAKSTFEVVTFAREAERLGTGSAAGAQDADARMRMVRALDTLPRTQGSDLTAAFELVGRRLDARKAKRPLVVVVTDGMLPSRTSPAEVAGALRGNGRAGRAPEVLFLVDDPLLVQRGLDPSSQVARVAAELGARIRLDRLASVERGDLDALLGSPQVLRDLEIDLPSNAELDGPAPAGLVAGHVLILEGHYRGRAPTQVAIRGRMGAKVVSRRIKASKRAALPEALAIPGDFGTPEAAAAEGFALPTWHNASLARETELSIAQVGYDTGPRRGRIDHEIVRRYMHMRVFPRASACYNRELAYNQVLGGRVLLELELGKGEVMHAQIAEQKFNYGVSKDFVDCITEAAWSLQIPAGALDTDTYLVRYPLRFSPPEGGQAPRARDESDTTFEMLMQRADALTEISRQPKAAPKNPRRDAPGPRDAPASHRPRR